MARWKRDLETKRGREILGYHIGAEYSGHSRAVATQIRFKKKGTMKVPRGKK